MSLKYLSIVIRGRVQGVSFRATTKAVADQLGIKGTVRNDREGWVHIKASGKELAMEQFMEWCQEGPDDAIVESMEVNDLEPEEFLNFEVIK